MRLFKPKPTTISYQYIKPVEEWTPEERQNWQMMIVKEKIEGLEDRVSHTVEAERAKSLFEHGKNIKDQLKPKTN